MARESLKALGPAKLSWSAILGGSFLALGLMVLLSWLGMAIGLTTVDTASRVAQGAEGAGIWLVIWTFLVPIISLFVGGLVAGRFGGITNNKGGAVHGAVTWGVTSLATAIFGALLLGGLVGGVVNLGGSVLGATGQAVTGVVGQAGPAGQALNVNAQDLLGPVNQSRAERGLAPLDAQNLQVALRDAVNRSLQQGQLNRDILVSSLVQNTEVSQAEAERLASQIEGQLGQAGTAVTNVAESALNAAEGTAWYAFFASLLSLAAATGAGMLAVSKSQKRPLTDPAYTHGHTTTVVRPGGEVYP